MLDAKWTEKSTSGACQLPGDKLVYWSTKRQQLVAMSSIEAEYMAIAIGMTTWRGGHPYPQTRLLKFSPNPPRSPSGI